MLNPASELNLSELHLIEEEMSVSNGVDLDPISLEIEKERVDYLEKSKYLQEQLLDLKSEIEGLKLEEKQTDYDLLHQEQVFSGENKYSTLRKVSSFKSCIFFMYLLVCVYVVWIINRTFSFVDQIRFH